MLQQLRVCVCVCVCLCLLACLLACPPACAPVVLSGCGPWVPCAFRFLGCSLSAVLFSETYDWPAVWVSFLLTLRTLFPKGCAAEQQALGPEVLQFSFASRRTDLALWCGLKLSINHWMPLALGSVCKSVCVCVCIGASWNQNECMQTRYRNCQHRKRQ